MTAEIIRRHWIRVIAAAVVAATGWAAHALEDAELTALLERIGTDCKDKHGYDWRNPGDLGEHELGVGEKAWRDCVYAGVRAEIVPQSNVPEQYERMIDDDIRYTAAIEAGEMTRFERWQKNRFGRQVAATNEAMAESTEEQEAAERLDKVMKHQLDELLRTPPPPNLGRFR